MHAVMWFSSLRCGFPIWSVSCLGVWLAAGAESGPLPRPLENIARGKPYTLSPAPDYSHCTDPEDLKQLTDGAYTTNYFWTQKGTVGWNNANPAIITLDLGQGGTDSGRLLQHGRRSGGREVAGSHPPAGER